MTTTTHGYQSDFARRYFEAGAAEGKAEGNAEGQAEGEARAVLAVLAAARGVEVSDEECEQILGCTDLDQLDVWIRRAVTADKAQDLFG